MNRHRQPARAAAVALLMTVCALTTLWAQYDPRLQYQKRGGWKEGLQPGPVSGFDVELVSALVDYREKVQGWPEELRLKFFLPEENDVDITVREIDYEWYYWLDEVEPSARRQGAHRFTWLSKAVLQHTSLEMYDLGAVVRLGKEGSSKEEHVAPALFYHSRHAPKIEGYRFSLKTNGNAQVSCKIRHGGKEIFQRPRTRQIADIPFTVVFPSQDRPEGWYDLELSGYFEMNNATLSKVVRFYHRPEVR